MRATSFPECVRARGAQRADASWLSVLLSYVSLISVSSQAAVSRGLKHSSRLASARPPARLMSYVQVFYIIVAFSVLLLLGSLVLFVSVYQCAPPRALLGRSHVFRHARVRTQTHTQTHRHARTRTCMGKAHS